MPRELAKILADCRDITVHRLLLSFTALCDRVCDMLMERAGRSVVRDEQQLFLEARQVLIVGRASRTEAVPVTRTVARVWLLMVIPRTPLVNRRAPCSA